MFARVLSSRLHVVHAVSSSHLCYVHVQVDVSANDSYEEEEILTVVHVADLLKERLAELKSAAHGGGTTVSGRKVCCCGQMHMQE